jgi:CRP-like cAMP-binding protein
MIGEDVQQGLRGFHFLLHEDLRLLLEHATRRHFRRGEVVLAAGAHRQSIFIVRAGLLRVERQGLPFASARLGGGEVFGGLSFVDDGEVDSAMIAEEETLVDVLEGPGVLSLLTSVPGLATRFYQSLAAAAAERLRAAMALVPLFAAEEVPQVTGFRQPRTGRLHAGCQIPPVLVGAVAAFDERMHRLDRLVGEGNLAAELDIQVEVSAACSTLAEVLTAAVAAKPHAAAALGAHALRGGFRWLMLSRTIDRAFSKPRGYAGDRETLALILADEDVGDGALGEYVDAWWLARPLCVALRGRVAHLTVAIAAAVAAWPGPEPCPILSLGCAGAPELLTVLGNPATRPVRATAVDLDPEALLHLRHEAERAGCGDRLDLCQDNVVRLSQGRGHTALPPQALIYTAGLADHLADGDVVRLLDWMHSRLAPGGSAIIGAIDRDDPDRALMDHILEWRLVRRSADELSALVTASRFGKAALSVAAIDPAGLQVYVQAVRAR